MRREIEQAHDLGAQPGIDVDDQRRDVREHEVQAEPGAMLVELGPTALFARASHVADHVALAQRPERVGDRDRKRAVVARPPQDRAMLDRGDHRARLARCVVQRVHQQLVDDARQPMHDRRPRAARLCPRADLADRGALGDVIRDRALADVNARREVLLEPE